MLHKASKLFWPVIVTPKNAIVKDVVATSRSQRLMTELGLIKGANNGNYHILPLGQRVFNKCVDLVHRHMQAVGGQQISLPILTSATLWEKSGRLSGDIAEFFMLRDRHGKQFLLSPTHEEAITAMLATAAPISHRQLPLRLYQVGPKFRDELKSRFGLMRAKEFLMKDMYTFDRNETAAHDTYEQLIGAYTNLFRQLGVPFVKVEASTGMMGGSISHEFHYMAATGEDRLKICKECGYAANAEISTMHATHAHAAADACSQCKAVSVTERRGIEVAHAFLLGDKYSQPLQATYLQGNGKPTPLIMGCFGLGISRLVAAALEVLSTENELRWPTLLAPFEVCIIGPKQGSNEQQGGDAIELALSRSLTEICGVDEVLHDDRKYLTIGKRLLDAKRMGYPLIVVIGSKATADIPTVELHLAGRERLDLEPHDLLAEVKKFNDHKTDILLRIDADDIPSPLNPMSLNLQI